MVESVGGGEEELSFSFLFVALRHEKDSSKKKDDSKSIGTTYSTS